MEDVRIETLTAPQPTAIVRRRASLPELAKVVPEACGVVWRALQSNHVEGAGRHVTLYRDDQINLEIGVEMSSAFAGVGEVIASELPRGSVATATHFGPYQTLRETHRAILDFCAAHDRALAGPSWEIYGDWEEAWNSDPAKIRTDVYYLLTLQE